MNDGDKVYLQDIQQRRIPSPWIKSGASCAVGKDVLSGKSSLMWQMLHIRIGIVQHGDSPEESWT